MLLPCIGNAFSILQRELKLQNDRLNAVLEQCYAAADMQSKLCIAYRSTASAWYLAMSHAWMLTCAYLQVVQLCRQLSRKDRERSHLLSLYGALCSCINSKEHRVREVVRDALQLAGQELSLIAPAPLNDSLLPISSV